MAVASFPLHRAVALHGGGVAGPGKLQGTVRSAGDSTRDMWFSESGPQMSSTDVTWELVSNADSQPGLHTDIEVQPLVFDTPHKRSRGTRKF